MRTKTAGKAIGSDVLYGGLLLKNVQKYIFTMTKTESVLRETSCHNTLLDFPQKRRENVKDLQSTADKTCIIHRMKNTFLIS